MADAVRCVDELPACFQPLYSGWRYFNAVQSEAFPVAFLSQANMVLSL